MVFNGILAKLTKTIKITAMVAIVGGMLYPMYPSLSYAHQHGNSNQVVINVLPELPKAWHENYNPFSPRRLPTVHHFMFEPLVIFERKNNAKPNFRLAESYKYSPKNIQITFELRPDLKWSDGQMLTADDVVFTFEMLKEYPFLDTKNIWTQLISDVVKINSRKVIFNLKRPNNLAHLTIGEMMIVPLHIWGGLPRLDLYLNKSMVGSGPLTEFHYQSGLYTQCRNPHYWDNASLKIDCIKVPRFTSKKRLSTAVSRLEIDWFSVPYQDIEKKLIGLYPDYYRYRLYDGDVVGLMFNYKTQHAGNRLAFDSPHFKRAVSHALKRQNILNIGTYGTSLLFNNLYGLPSGLLNWYTGSDDISPSNAKIYTQKEINKLLMDNNFSDVTGDGWVNNPNSTPIHMEISVPNNDTVKLNVARIIKENLRTIAIESSVKSQVAKEYPNIIKTGRYETAIITWDRFTIPFQFYLNFYSQHTSADYRLSSGFNKWNYDEQLLIYQENSADKAVEATQNLAKVFHDTLPIIPLYNEILWHEYSIKNFDGWNQDHITGSVHQSNPERLLQLLLLQSK